MTDNKNKGRETAPTKQPSVNEARPIKAAEQQKAALAKRIPNA